MMKKFYNFISKDNEIYELYVYGEIIGGSEKWTEDDVTFKDFKDKLALIPDNSTLNMYLNTPGGNVFTTQAIIALLKRAKERNISINAYIDGLGASCGSWLPCVADNIYIYNQSILMLHKPMSVTLGNANDMKKEIEILDKIENDVMIPLYMSKANTGVTEDDIRNMLSKETWLTSAEIAEYFNVTLLEEEKQLVACADKEILSKYKNTPENLLKIEDKNIAEDLAIKNKEIEIALALI